MPVNNALLGILCGVSAGALWGIVFLAPQVLYHFSPIEVALGRFFFALPGLFFLQKVWQLVRSLTRKKKKSLSSFLVRPGFLALYHSSFLVFGHKRRCGDDAVYWSFTCYYSTCRTP